MKTKLIFTFLLVVATTLTLTAQTPKSAEPTNQDNKKSCYVDANKNGVCDNYENKTCKSTTTNEVKKGKQHACGTCNAKSKGKCCKGSGSGNCCSAKTKGHNFIDKNNNGVCDHKE